MAETCLLIVDVQKGFITETTALIPAAVAPLQAEYPLVYASRFVNPEGSMHRRLLHWSRFAPDSEEAALAFAPARATRVFEKTGYSCLAGPFAAALRAGAIAEVHLCGIATDGCVLKTAVDLFEAGVKPVVLADHCGSHGGPECHAAGLLLLRRFIGQDQVIGGG